jgi:ribosomal protein S18 acetylase RimI-like enzyme
MQTTPQITVFHEDHRQQVIKLWEKCGLLFPGNDPDYDIDLKIKFQPHLFFILLIDGIAAGSVMAGFDGHRGWLNYLCVHPDFRNMGYGRDLIAHAVQQLKKTGCPKINLQIRNSNTGVIEFYKKAGFYIHDVMCMQLKI